MKRVALPFLFVAVGACGDPMLPADFSGPPAAVVKGNVLPGTAVTRDTLRPRMSLEWLDDLKPALVGQSLSYQRSEKLQTDWDIGLTLPQKTATFDARVGGGKVRIGVAKIVYFDDRDGDGKLDWSCGGATCDRVMAISSQFVVFVEKPPYCQSFEGAAPKARLPTGYHYYSNESGSLRTLSPADPLSFTLIDRAPSEIDPTSDLQSFATDLVNGWVINPTSGC
jgi:hypothetical protein